MTIRISQRNSKTVPFFMPRDEFRLWFNSTYVATGKVSITARFSRNKQSKVVEIVWNDLAAQEEYRTHPKTIAMKAERRKWNTTHNQVLTLVNASDYDETNYAV